MKRSLTVLLTVMLTVSLAACSFPGSEDGRDRTEWKVDSSYENEGTVLSCERLPQSTGELEDGLDLTDPYQTAYGTLLALCVYETDPELGISMLDYLNGPEDVNAYDRSFLKDQFAQYPYVARSYFTDTDPGNDYVTETYEALFFENMYSSRDETHLALWTFSSGADSERSLGLCLKPSEGKWYVSDWYGILAGIRLPASEDGWN